MELLNKLKIKNAAFVTFLLIIAISLPLTMLSLRQSRNQQPLANAATVVSFSQSSSQGAPIQATKNQLLPLDVMIDPGTNLVSLVTLVMEYDANKFSVDQTNGFQVNAAAFPTVLEGPIYASGRVAIKVSIGSDPTKAIKEKIKAGTLALTPIDGTGNDTSAVRFTTQTSAQSIGPNDSASDNVVQSTVPAYIAVQGTSVNPTATSSNQPFPTSTPIIPDVTETITPTGIGGPNPTTQITLQPSGEPTIEPTAVPLPTIAPTGIPQPTIKIPGDNNHGRGKGFGRVIAIIMQNRAIFINAIIAAIEKDTELSDEQKQKLTALFNQYLDRFSKRAKKLQNISSEQDVVKEIKAGLQDTMNQVNDISKDIETIRDGLVRIVGNDSSTDANQALDQLNSAGTNLATIDTLSKRVLSTLEKINTRESLKAALPEIKTELGNIKKEFKSAKEKIKNAEKALKKLEKDTEKED